MSSTLPVAAAEKELVELSSRLEDRASITHFVWAFGLACTAFVAGGVAIKLMADSERTPKLAFVLAAVAAGETLVALLKMVSGLRLHSVELSDFERLKSLRKELCVDLPQLPSA